MTFCQGSGDGGGGGGTPGNQDATAAKSSLGGSWGGIYKSKVTDGSSELRQSQATLLLEEASPQGGKLTLKLTDFNGVGVTANYKVFDNKTLLLEILESNFSPMGLSGKSAVLNYELLGNSLSLSNDTLSILLVREEDSKPKTPDGSEPQESYLGRWQCRDQANSLWIFNLRTKEQFFLEIYPQGGNQRGIWMSGTMSEALPDYALKITKSDIAKYQGMELTGRFSKDLLTFDITRKDSSEKLACSRP